MSHSCRVLTAVPASRDAGFLGPHLLSPLGAWASGLLGLRVVSYPAPWLPLVQSLLAAWQVGSGKRNELPGLSATVLFNPQCCPLANMPSHTHRKHRKVQGSPKISSPLGQHRKAWGRGLGRVSLLSPPGFLFPGGASCLPGPESDTFLLLDNWEVPWPVLEDGVALPLSSEALEPLTNFPLMVLNPQDRGTGKRGLQRKHENLT